MRVSPWARQLSSPSSPPAHLLLREPVPLATVRRMTSRRDAADDPENAAHTRFRSLVDDPTNYYWLPQAACAGMDLTDFFTGPGCAAKTNVIAVCRSCPVRRECLVHAYTRGVNERGIDSGYFGGLSAGQRKKLTLDEALAYIEEDRPAR